MGMDVWEKQPEIPKSFSSGSPENQGDGKWGREGRFKIKTGEIVPGNRSGERLKKGKKRFGKSGMNLDGNFSLV